jgi:hypothetical protein
VPEITPLGFKKPLAATELVRWGAGVIADNAQLSQELFAGLSAQVASVSTPFNIGMDIDGTPFFQSGASGLTLEADTDGVPYFL